MDNYNTGIRVARVNVVQAQPPDAVRPAFDDVIRAREDEQRAQNQAQQYANQRIPEARGEAQRQIEQENAYKQQAIAQAEGEASRFDQLLTEYLKAPEVTRQRLYIESLQDVMTASSKIMIDVDGGNNLIGVGFDNKLYIKNDPSDADSDSNTNIMMKKDKTYENRWIQRSEPFINKDIIYILYKQNNQNITIDINNSKDIALIIDTNGDLFYFSYNNSEDMTLNPITTNLSLIKIYFDQYGYLLGISSDLKLYRSRKQIYFDNTYEDPKNKDLSEIGNDIIPNEILFDEDKPNPTPVLDIIYDYDSRLFGLGIFPARKRTILMKQKYECSNCFFSTAFGFSHEVNNFYSKKDDIKLSKEDILKLKSGYDIGITQIKKYPELNDINAAYQKSSLNARKTLRKYCQKYNNNNRNSNTQSFEMISRIEEQEKKIDELNKSIAQMIQFDPDKKKIQEDIGIYSF